MALRLHPLRALWLALFVLSVQSAAHAASYNVEILLFRWDQGTSNENWSANNGWDIRTQLPEANWTPLPQSSWTLNGAENALDQARGRVTPVFHTAWRQQVPNRTNPQGVPIRSSETAANGLPRIEGSVAATAGRFIHLALDLVLREDASAPSANDPSGLGSSNGIRRTGYAPEPKLYRLKATRKMSRNQLHYIDHPKVGALVRVW